MDYEPKLSPQRIAANPTTETEIETEDAAAERRRILQRSLDVGSRSTPPPEASAAPARHFPGLDGTRISRSPAGHATSAGAATAHGARRIQRAHRPSARQTSDGIIRRDFLADAITSRRGEATGMDAEDVELEAEQQRNSPSARFFGEHGKRETAEAQTVGADPMLDRLKIQDVVSSKRRLGAEGLPQLLQQGRDRQALKSASMHEVGDESESVASSFQQSRIGLDMVVARHGDEVTEKRELRASLGDVRNSVQQALAVATWDATQLTEYESAAKSSVEALEPGSQSETDARLAFDGARALVAAAEARAQQDIQWMESLLPHTEAIITEGIGAENKAVMNNSMTISWRSITRNGAASQRDVDTVQNAVDSLAREVDRKTEFDAELAASRLKGGNAKARKGLIALLQKKTKINRRIKEILALEDETATLQKLAAALTSVDILPRMLATCSDRALLIKLTQENQSLVEPDRLKAIVAAKCGSGDADALSEMVKADARFFEPSALALMLSRWPDRQRLSAVAKLAKNNAPALLRITKKFGNAAHTDFVLDGEGRSPLDIVDRYAKADRVWLGQTTPAPTLEPNGTSYADIESVAVPKLKDGTGPVVGGYAGNRTFDNVNGPPDMLLPKRTSSGAVITYLEFDIKPYRTPWQRGTKRYVKGSDGRRYYTDDHYGTFGLVP